MPRSLRFSAAAIIVLLTLAAAACGGSESSSSKTTTAPIRSFKDGPANAHVTAGDQTIDYKGGTCEKGPGDKYLALNIGEVNGSGDYFGLLAGQHPSAGASAHSAQGGGNFAGQDETLVTFRHASRSYLLRFSETKVTLAPDLASGAFTSVLTTADASGGTTAVSGTFTC